MCMDGKAFRQYATAEKELCEMAGAVLTNIINEIESRHGIRIAELRVTMDRAHSLNGWPAANCVMVREEEVDATHEAKAERDGRPVIADARTPARARGSQEATSDGTNANHL